MPTPHPLPSRLPRVGHGGILTRILVTVVVLLAAGGFAFYWFLLRDDAKPKPTISRTKVVAGGSVDGTWKVTPNDTAGSFAQYRVHEKFADGLVDNEATGQTRTVTGSLTVNGTTLSDVTVTADLSDLKSNNSFRDIAARDQSLQTSRFPTAKFVATGPITLPSTPVKGATTKVSVPGQLTLHGVTKSVTAPLEGRWDGKEIQVVGVLPIAFSDYSIAVPHSGAVAEVDDHGSLELKLFFVK
ncbi:MAG: YceI family protein [Acidimicrobiia bacterium]